MDKEKIQQILNYYLEYEIYNIASSSQIKINKKSSIIIKDILKERYICENIDKLKQIKIREKIEKFSGKKIDNKGELVGLIEKELINLDEEKSNQVQISFRISSLIKENLKYKMDEKVITNFANELCNIKASKEFWLYAHNISCIKKEVRKLSMFILKCEVEKETINIIDTNINVETLYTILSIILNKEITDIALEYQEQISNFSKEIKAIIDGGNINHILELYYSKLDEYIHLQKEDIKNISKVNCRYNMNEEYIISLEELAEDGIKNIKEDIELLNKLIDNDNYIPKLLSKYLNGSIYKKDINNPEYSKAYRGNYKSIHGVGYNQYKIVNTINDNDLIAIEGPPGTGKTSLLKEIIANKIVERADLIFKNWDRKLELNNYYGTTYYNIDWYNNNRNTIKSIVVTSKNGEAIENVGKEINQEIRYMFPVARKYKRTQRINGSEKRILQKYKGIICLPLGKQDNVQDFKAFLYQEYIPMLNRLQSKVYSKEVLDKIKENYESKCKQIKNYEELVKSINRIKDKKRYYYGIEKFSEQDKIIDIQKMFLEDKEKTKETLYKLKSEKEHLLKHCTEQEEKLNYIKKNINDKEKQIKNSQKVMIEGKSYIQNLKNKKQSFDRISKNILTKILNFREYKKNKKIDFCRQINEIEISNKVELEKISQYIKDKSNLEKQRDENSIEYNILNEKYENLKEKYQVLNEKIKEMELIEEFNRNDKSNTFWDYDNILEIYGKSSLNILNQELFELALKLNEAYIAKNSKEIIENLKLFLANGDISYICQKFYDSTDIYNEDKQKAIRCLWNTLFLCFPVVTTTLDSFSKRCFHLISEYIDLELIDEAGQILPHNLVTAIYRAKKAVIVGDVNQIEPIYNNVNKNFYQYQKSIGEKFESIKVESNSIQALANKNTDILDNDDNIILNDHYRCEENIINFSNENVYANKLNMHIQNKKDKPFFDNMIALDVRGKKTPKENVNEVEVKSCIETVKYIKEQNEKEISIAIITPFREQKAEIEKSLDKEGITDVKVGTVHAFQGQEKDYIIFSQVIDSVETKWAINFIGKKCNMLNVAVTRAKKQFIYLGNLNVAMQTENYIAKLVKYIKKNGLIYSLYDIDNTSINNNFDEKILKILQPELKLENDDIGLYIKQNIKDGIISDAKQHYEFLRYAIKNTKRKIYIMSPWIRQNVMNEEFLSNIKKLKEQDCTIKIVFGYKNGNKNISNAKELSVELKRTNSLGYATQEEVEEIAKEMYQIIGKENFIYAPPTHAKILIIDDKYMCIGSHNWLSNAGKSNEQQRAKEGTRVTTNKYAIDYVKEQFFKENKDDNIR